MASEEFPEVIYLSVGGTHTFTTHLSTLTKHKDSRLAGMFTGRADVHKDRDGRYFLDLDGATFTVILDYLKYGFTPDQFPNLDFKQDEIMRLYASTLSLGLKDLAMHLENHFPLLVENKQIFSSVIPESGCVDRLHIGEQRQPNQPDGGLFSAQTSTTFQRTPFGIVRSLTPQKAVFGNKAAETTMFGQSSPFKLTPASTFGQPSSQGQVREKSFETERLASPKQQQQQRPNNFGKLPDIPNPLGHVQNPASVPSVPFGASANGGSEMPTWATVRPEEVQDDSNEQKISDGEGLPTNEFEGFTGYR